jgi:hypothetical protein
MLALPQTVCVVVPILRRDETVAMEEINSYRF